MRTTTGMMRAFMVLSMALFAAACSSDATAVRELTVQQERIPPDAQIGILAEGGIAALRIEKSVTLNPPHWQWTTGHLCSTSTPPCLAPVSFESGSLSPGAAQRLFEEVRDANVFQLKDDYGVTQGGADMFLYTIRVVWDGRAKTIRGDDGSLPDEVQELLGAVHRAIEAAR